jgi:hypothetical protein
LPPWGRRDVARYGGRLGERVNLDGLLDAWERDHPEEAAARAAWWDSPEAEELERAANRDVIGEELERDRQRAENERRELAASLERLERERKRLGLDGSPEARQDVTERARRYLDAIPADTHVEMVKAAVAAVRGWAIEEGMAVVLLESWAAGRWPRRELARAVRWASRRRGELGYLLAGRARVR